MEITSKPTKEDIRNWLIRRCSSDSPPERDRIREELGWQLRERRTSEKRSDHLGVVANQVTK